MGMLDGPRLLPMPLEEGEAVPLSVRDYRGVVPAAASGEAGPLALLDPDREVAAPAWAVFPVIPVVGDGPELRPRTKSPPASRARPARQSRGGGRSQPSVAPRDRH